MYDSIDKVKQFFNLRRHLAFSGGKTHEINHKNNNKNIEVK